MQGVGVAGKLCEERDFCDKHTAVYDHSTGNFMETYENVFASSLM